jgi:hypothetical protein
MAEKVPLLPKAGSLGEPEKKEPAPVKDEIAEANKDLEPAQRKLIKDLMEGNVNEIKEFDGDWNFLLKIKSRRAPTIPLCLLSRPELCGSLRGVPNQTKIELVKHAIQHGADFRYNDGQAVTDICYQGVIDLYHVVVNALGPEYITQYRHPASKCTLLHMAAHDGRAEMCRVLLRDGLQADEPDKNGQTPLFYAYARGIVNLSTGKVLFHAGADPFKIDPTSECSPFSLSLANCPDFALLALDNLREVGSNRGDKRTVTYTFQGLHIKDPSKPENVEGVELTFPRQKRNPVPGGWDTFYVDKTDRNTAIGYMVEFGLSPHLQHPVIRAILDRQWEAFARRTYYLRVAEFAGMMLMMMIVNGSWPRTSVSRAHYDTPVSPWLMIPIAIAIPLDFRMLLHEYSEFSHLGLAGYFKSFWNIVDIAWHLDFLVLVTLKILCFFDVYVFPPVVDYLSTFLFIFFCIKILQFASVPRVTGPLVTAFKYMLNDMKNFFTIFVIFFVTFTNAVWPFFKNGSGDDRDYTYGSMYVTLFNWMLGGFDIGDTDGFEGAESVVGTALCFTYVIISSIMLLNMLIAMMSNSYGNVDKNAEGEWILDWADEIQGLIPTADKDSVAQMMKGLVEDNNNGVEETIDPLEDVEHHDEESCVEEKIQQLTDVHSQLEQKLENALHSLEKLTRKDGEEEKGGQ